MNFKLSKKGRYKSWKRFEKNLFLMQRLSFKLRRLKVGYISNILVFQKFD